MGPFSLAYEQEPYYLFVALAGSLLFIVQLVLMIVTGAGSEAAGVEADGAFDGIDVDVDMTGAEAIDANDASHVDSTAAFKLFSIQSIFAFLMGFGWMGLACRIEWGLTGFSSFLASMAFGVFAMLLSAYLNFQLKKLSGSSIYDVRTSVGQIGTVYLKIPAKGMGQGQVEVSVSGSKRILKASSNGGEISSFTTVEVIDIHNDGAVVVRPKV